MRRITMMSAIWQLVVVRVEKTATAIDGKFFMQIGDEEREGMQGREEEGSSDGFSEMLM